MKRRIILLIAIGLCLYLAFSSVKRILMFRSTSEQVDLAEERLAKIKKENENLKQEYEYKKSGEFAEEEIRNKLGLAKEGETVVVVPKENDEVKVEVKKKDISNFDKWMNLFFEG